MGGQIFGGGVIVLVAVALWLVYLLPTLHRRHQHAASERNAVRLSQALRVLAETSETPEEVRLELNARTVHAQQRQARRAQDEQASLARRIQAEKDSAALREKQRELAVLRADPSRRRARARRVTRLVVTALLLGGVVLGAFGGIAVASGGGALPLVGGFVVVVVSLALLGRLSAVARRTGGQAMRVVAPAPQAVQDVALPRTARAWTPRELPRPLASSAGTRAAAVLDAAQARDALRQAAVDEAIRERAERAAPPSIDVARPAAASNPWADMGIVDDAEIDAGVSRLASRRAVGE